SMNAIRSEGAGFKPTDLQTGRSAGRHRSESRKSRPIRVIRFTSTRATARSTFERAHRALCAASLASRSAVSAVIRRASLTVGGTRAEAARFVAFRAPSSEALATTSRDIAVLALDGALVSTVERASEAS